MKETGLSLEKFATVPLLYAGESVKGLERGRKMDIANLVSTKLTEHPNTMIQYSPDAIFKSMNEGRAACVLDLSGKLKAFAQYWPYDVDNTGDEMMNDLNVFEVGSWLSFSEGPEKGHGKKVFEAAWAAGRETHPDAGFIAIVEEGNQRAGGILRSVGGEWLSYKESKQVQAVSKRPALMSIYRLNEHAGK